MEKARHGDAAQGRSSQTGGCIGGKHGLCRRVQGRRRREKPSWSGSGQGGGRLARFGQQSRRDHAGAPGAGAPGGLAAAEAHLPGCGRYSICSKSLILQSHACVFMYVHVCVWCVCVCVIFPSL
jgi:hypothetical protein